MNARLAFVLCVLLFFPTITVRAQMQEGARLWLSTPDRSQLLTLQKGPIPFSSSVTSLPTVTVNDDQQYQTIDGFGFALTGGSAQLLMRMDPAKRSAILKEIFGSTDAGLASSYLRMTIGASDMNERVYSYDDLPDGQTDAGMTRFSLGPDHADVIPVLKEILAINPRVRILASPWSAPAWMKSNQNAKGGMLKPEFYGAYAEYFVKYIQAMKAEGIRIDAITIQNEPLNPKNTPSMVVFAAQEDTFISRFLGPAFQKAGIDTKILLYDHNADAPSYPLSILSDHDASRFVDGVAFHFYGGEASTLTKVHDEYPNKNLYLTEQSVTEDPNGPLGIAGAVNWVMIGATRNWSRNVLLWNLAADPNSGPHTNDGGCTGCRGAITLDGNNVTRNVAYYTVAHFSRFVPPGSVRIGSNELEQVGVVAFRTPEDKIVLILANTRNFPADLNVQYHGKVFKTTLPAESVGTYVW
jgi:glucosylceramidase